MKNISGKGSGYASPLLASIRWLATRERIGRNTLEDPSASCQRLLSQAAFLRTLRLEYERAERSLDRFVLMLVDFEETLLTSEAPVLSRIRDVLLAVIREIDSFGWYKTNSTFGVIFTGIPAESVEAAMKAIELRIWNTLQQEFRVDQYERIRISFEFFPGNKNRRPPASPGRPALHPELFVRSRRQRASDLTKRLIDIAGSLAGLVLLAPIFALIGIAIKLSSKGPILFRQIRIGQRGIPFTLLKFRTMHQNSDSAIHREFVREFIAGNTALDSAEAGPGTVYKITADPRVTPLGRFLRKTSLDELPQFLNVLRGEMSLVGPRPPIPYEVEAYQPWHWRRVFEVKPGLTGLWQVSGRSRTTFDEMVRLDLRYAKTRSLWVDLRILLQTPAAVFYGKGAY